MPFDPLALLLAIPLELLIIASVAPWRALQQWLARLYARLDKAERGRRTLQVRGGILALAALAIGGLVGSALQTLPSARPFRSPSPPLPRRWRSAPAAPCVRSSLPRSIPTIRATANGWPRSRVAWLTG